MSAVVLTRNEEALVERCLDGLQWADQILVVDSESVDRTRALAEGRGADVVVQPFLGWSRQRNAAAAAAAHDWVFFVDADEYVGPALAAQIRRLLAQTAGNDWGAVVDRRNEFLGRLLPNSQRRRRRADFVRLYNRRVAHWDETLAVHEVVAGVRRRVFLRPVLVQWRRQTFPEMAARVLRYSNVEAQALHDAGARGSMVRMLLGPIGRFAWQLFVKGEWRVGRRGVLHASLRACADYLRQASLLALNYGVTDLHPPHYEETQPDPGARE